MKWLRKLFGLCEHDYEHVSNIVTTDGPMEVLMCWKCFKMQFRIWPSAHAERKTFDE